MGLKPENSPAPSADSPDDDLSSLVPPSRHVPMNTEGSPAIMRGVEIPFVPLKTTWLDAAEFIDWISVREEKSLSAQEIKRVENNRRNGMPNYQYSHERMRNAAEAIRNNIDEVKKTLVPDPIIFTMQGVEINPTTGQILKTSPMQFDSKRFDSSISELQTYFYDRYNLPNANRKTPDYARDIAYGIIKLTTNCRLTDYHPEEYLPILLKRQAKESSSK